MLSQSDWASIHKAIEASRSPSELIQGRVTKRDIKTRRVWIEEFGDEPIPIAAFDYQVKLYNGNSDEYNDVSVIPELPSVGEVILVAKAAGSRRLPRAVGVIGLKPVTKKNLSPAHKVVIPESFAPGMIMAWAPALANSGSEEPTPGWLTCNGAAVSRTTYAALFTAIGTNYGTGDGSTTFNLPDFRGKVLIHKSTDTEFDALNETGGEKTHTLTTPEIPAHTHTMDSQGNHSHNFGGSPAVVDSGTTQASSGGAVRAGTGTSSSTNSTGAHTHTNANAGGGGAHNNLQPYRVAGGYIIKY